MTPQSLHVPVRLLLSGLRFPASASAATGSGTMSISANSAIRSGSSPTAVVPHSKRRGRAAATTPALSVTAELLGSLRNALQIVQRGQQRAGTSQRAEPVVEYRLDLAAAVEAR